LLLRALESVLVQTFRQFEVIVVVDGPDKETEAALAAVQDERLRVIVNARSLTAAGARNAGAAQAVGEWIAFLDDDDEWLPDKLEKQVAFARDRGGILISCLSRVITPNAEFAWPERIYGNDIPIDDYLFDRRSTFAGSSFLQTSSYFLPRAVYENSPFRTGCADHDDWDFLLRLSKGLGVRIETIPEPLVKVYLEDERASVSRSGTWLASLGWVERVRPILTDRAYSGFCLIVAGSRAASERAYPAFWRLLSMAFKGGSPRIRHVVTFLAFWVIPSSVRRRLRAVFRGGSLRLSGPYRDTLAGVGVNQK
jgi:glycosyltransferase involved in cell wall biosynthesis